LNKIIVPLSDYQIVQQVKDHYNTISAHFSQTRTKPLWAEILPFVKSVKSGSRVLDVGCGNGRLLTELSSKKIDYLGIDISKGLIELAKQRFPSRRFLIRDITEEESWARIGKFDTVFCLAALHHIPDRERQYLVLKQIFEHTKPGGKLVISVWNLWQTRYWKMHLEQILKKKSYNNFSYLWIPYKISDGKKVTKQVNRFCKAFLPGELLNLVKQAGFKIDTFYFTSRGQTRMSIFKGQNFCLLARKSI
jgi:2-polyprenyl-3-methyl-5-hydroxy-6-metoxy-1,4-benzoquinol methylase